MREQQQIMAAHRGGGQVGLASGLILAAQGVKEYQGAQRGQGCQGVGSSGKSRTLRTSGRSARRISSTIKINLGRSTNSRDNKKANDKEVTRSEDDIKPIRLTVTTRGRSLTMASGAVLKPVSPSSRPNTRAIS